MTVLRPMRIFLIIFFKIVYFLPPISPFILRDTKKFQIQKLLKFYNVLTKKTTKIGSVLFATVFTLNETPCVLYNFTLNYKVSLYLSSVIVLFTCFEILIAWEMRNSE